MFFDVGVIRTVTATRYIRVEADSREEAENKAVDQAGDEDWDGCVVDYDFDLCGDTKEVADLDTPPGFKPEPVEQCVFCGKELPRDMAQVADEGWHPCYWEGDKQQDGPACPACLAKYCVLEQESGEFLLKEIKGEFVSVWGSGHEFHTPCTVNPATRIVHTESCETGDDAEDLQREYVILDGEEYEARPADERDNYSIAEQRQMFFYE